MFTKKSERNKGNCNSFLYLLIYYSIIQCKALNLVLNTKYIKNSIYEVST